MQYEGEVFKVRHWDLHQDDCCVQLQIMNAVLMMLGMQVFVIVKGWINRCFETSDGESSLETW